MVSYEVLEVEKIEVAETVQFHLRRLLSSVKRKLTFKLKFKDPWVVLASETLSPGYFLYMVSCNTTLFDSFWTNRERDTG